MDQIIAEYRGNLIKLERITLKDFMKIKYKGLFAVPLYYCYKKEKLIVWPLPSSGVKIYRCRTLEI